MMNKLPARDLTIIFIVLCFGLFCAYIEHKQNKQIQSLKNQIENCAKVGGSSAINP